MSIHGSSANKITIHFINLNIRILFNYILTNRIIFFCLNFFSLFFKIIFFIIFISIFFLFMQQYKIPSWIFRCIQSPNFCTQKLQIFLYGVSLWKVRFFSSSFLQTDPITSSPVGSTIYFTLSISFAASLVFFSQSTDHSEGSCMFNDCIICCCISTYSSFFTLYSSNYIRTHLKWRLINRNSNFALEFFVILHIASQILTIVSIQLSGCIDC